MTETAPPLSTAIPADLKLRRPKPPTISAASGLKTKTAIGTNVLTKTAPSPIQKPPTAARMTETAPPQSTVKSAAPRSRRAKRNTTTAILYRTRTAATHIPTAVQTTVVNTPKPKNASVERLSAPREQSARYAKSPMERSTETVIAILNTSTARHLPKRNRATKSTGTATNAISALKMRRAQRKF